MRRILPLVCLLILSSCSSPNSSGHKTPLFEPQGRFSMENCSFDALEIENKFIDTPLYFQNRVYRSDICVEKKCHRLLAFSKDKLCKGLYLYAYALNKRTPARVLSYGKVGKTSVKLPNHLVEGLMVSIQSDCYKVLETKKGKCTLNDLAKIHGFQVLNIEDDNNSYSEANLKSYSL